MANMGAKQPPAGRTEDGFFWDKKGLMMNNNREDAFTDLVTKFVDSVLQDWKKLNSQEIEAERMALNALVVEKKKQIPNGWLPKWCGGPDWNDLKWTWQSFPHEIDVVLGREAELDGSQYLLPLVAIENKVDGWLQTTEIGSKDTIYGALKEHYPCVLTCLLLEENERRNIRDDTMLRNGRHFDIILMGWNKREQLLLRQAVTRHLDYAVGYWGR